MSTETDDLNRILPGNSLPPVAADFSGLCLIEVKIRHRNGRARWYCADSNGYTDIPGYAGVYTAAEAARICNGRTEVYAVDARRVADIARRSAERLMVAVTGGRDPIATVRARHPRAFALPPGALCGQWSIVPHANSSPLPDHIATGATESEAWAAAAALVLEQP